MLVWEMVGNAHNDGSMMFFGLLAVWFLVSRWDALVVLALSAGTLVKIPVALIGPALFVGTLRRNWARAVEGALLGLVLAIAVYRPFWVGPETLTVLNRTDLFTASLGAVLEFALAPMMGAQAAQTLARSTSLALFAVVASIALIASVRADSDRALLTSAYATILGGLLLATTWFQAWYVVWPFALGAALATRPRHLEVALLSLGGLLQYFVFIYLWVIGVFPPEETLALQSAAYLAVVGPLLIGLAVRGLWSTRRWQRPVSNWAARGEYH
jgi:hypothetical protein